MIMLTAGAKLLSHGCNSFGQLGFTGTSRVHTPSVIPALARRRVRSVAVGYGHVLALMEDAEEVLAWGRNHNGQLGLGHTEWTEGPEKVKLSTGVGEARIRSIAAGQAHSLAVFDNGDVYGWGSCDHGQLGPVADLVEAEAEPDTEVQRLRGLASESKEADAAAASAPSESKVRDEGAEPMLNKAWQSRMVLAPALVPGLKFDSGSRVAQVFACANQSAALTACGCVFVFGDNEYGQARLRAVGVPHKCSTCLVLYARSPLRKPIQHACL